MKNIFIVSIILSISYGNIFSQKLISDVNSIFSIYNKYNSLDYSQYKEADESILLGIFSKYSNPDFSQEQVAEEFGKYPYFTSYDLPSEYPGDRANDLDLRLFNINSATDLITKTTPSFSFGNTLIKSLVQYLANRTREELKITFINDINDKLNKPEYNIVLKNTKTSLTDFIDMNWNLDQYVSSLQMAMRQDIAILPSSLSKYINETNVMPKLKNDERILLSDFLGTAQQIVDSESIFLIMDELKERNSSAFDKGLTRIRAPIIWELRNQLSFSSVMMNLLSSDDKDRNFIEFEDLEDIIEHDVKSDIFFGLLYSKLIFENLKYGDNEQLLAEKLVNLAPPNDLAQQQGIMTHIRSLIEEGNTLDKLNEELSSGSFKNYIAQSNAYYLYIDSFKEIIKSAFGIILNDQDLLKNLEEPLAAFEAAAKLPVDVIQQDYMKAIVNSSKVIDFVLKDDEVNLFATIRGVMTIAASFANAKTPDELSAVIEYYASPVGSFSNKRDDKRNISLNSYVGPIFGLSQNVTDIKESYKPGLGVFAPIGIAASWSSKNSKKSYSLFPFLFDLGAPVAYRFTNDDLSVLSDVRLQDIISPGFQFSYGFPKLLSMNFGFQWAPDLRSVNESGVTLEEVKSFRYGLGLAVDLPLTTISSKAH